MSIDFAPSEIWAYYSPIFGEATAGTNREYRGPCPVHKGRNNNFVVDSETGLCFCFSKCNRGWDMIGLDQELFGGGFAAARRRVFAVVGRQWNEPSAGELARLAEQRAQDVIDEPAAVCWLRGSLQHIERQLSEDKAHLFASDPGERRAARIRVRQYSERQRQLLALGRSELLAEFRAKRITNRPAVEHWVKAGADDLEDCRTVCVAIVRLIEMSASQFPAPRVGKLGGSKS